MKFGYHGNNDWCHICGDRHYATVDIFYSENAEHRKDESQYLRICRVCLRRALDILSQSAPTDFRVGFIGELKSADDHLNQAISIVDGKIPAREMDSLLKAKRHIHRVRIFFT